MKKLPLLLLFVAFAALAPLLYVAAAGAQAPREPQRLFEPVGAEKSAERFTAAAGDRPRASTAAVREQEIRVNFGAVDFAEARELSLPLLDGVSYRAVRSESEGFAASHGGGLVWRGKISGPGLWSGDVTLSVVGRALSGLIYSPGGVYEIVPQKDFGHLLVEIDQSLFPPCAGTLPALPGSEAGADAASKSAVARSQSAAGAQTAADDGGVIDVLVAYTGEVRTALGGTTQAETFAQQAVESTNTAYINSRINTRLRLVGTLEVGYTEGGSLSAALSWAAGDPAVIAARNSTKADMVSFVVERGNGGCGVAFLMTHVGTGFSPSAFSVAARSCAVGNLTFAHELGHNQGCQHNPENAGPPESSSFPYAYGHYVDGSFRTVMSYSDPCTPPNFCPRAAYFSNPSVSFNGVPTGVADQRDNARVINNTAAVVSQFRDSGNAPPPANDNFASAASIGGAAGAVAGANNGATKEPGEPNHGFRVGGASVWYDWQAPSNGTATLTTAGSTFNTLLGVYTGGSVGGLTLVAGSDDVSPADATSSVTFNATAGTTYRIAVDGYTGAAGSLALNWSLAQTCAYTLSPPSQTFPAAGGAGSFSVNAPAGCAWTAATGDPFVAITGGGSGSGSGTVSFSVAANGATVNRVGVVTVAGQTFLAHQDASSGPTLRLGSAAYSASEAARKVLIDVTRSGSTAEAVSVSYATGDGTASRLGDYTQTLGALHFAAGETTKTVTVYVADDVLQEGPETFTFTLSNPAGAALVAPAAAVVTVNSDDATTGPNPVDNASFNADFFVRQHYIDFLNREPDAQGLAHWTGQTTNCGSPNPEVCRVNVSAAFFRSIEFQNTGYLVYRMYKAAYGDAASPNVPGTVPAVRLEEFLNDTQRIGAGVVVNQGDWAGQLEANKRAYSLEFVQRARFRTAHGLTSSPAEFVDALRANTGSALSQSERDQLVAELAANNTDGTRASVLRRVAEDADLQAGESNRAFVLMEYFGYLRRNPSDAPNTDFTGWKFWLDKLNEFGGDYVRAEMVRAFITSIEYRQRFGP